MLYLFFVQKDWKAQDIKRYGLTAVAQLEQSPHRTKVKDLTITATSNIGENDYKRYQKIVIQLLIV